MHARTYRRWHAHSLTHKHAYERALARPRTHTHARTLPHAQTRTRSHARAHRYAYAAVHCGCGRLSRHSVARHRTPAVTGAQRHSNGKAATRCAWQPRCAVWAIVVRSCSWPQAASERTRPGGVSTTAGGLGLSFVELYDTRLVHTEPAAGTGKQECQRRLEPVEIDLKAPADSEQPRGPLPVARLALRLPGGA